MTRPPPAPDDPAMTPNRRAAPPTPAVLAVISVGGAVGALARYQLGRSWPQPPTAFPWTTLLVNLTGCLLIGVLLMVLAERAGAHPLLRPFLATGVLGGYTTFSTYSVDLHRLLTDGHPATALVYLLATLGGALAATATGTLLARRVLLR